MALDLALRLSKLAFLPCDMNRPHDADSAFEHAARVVGMHGRESVPNRLKGAQAMLYKSREHGFDASNFRAAAKTLRGCGIDLMKAAAALDGAASSLELGT